MDSRSSRNEQREQIRARIQNSDADEKQRVVIPAEDNKSLNDDNANLRVCAYCRVSTDDPAQTTSYELQKMHYEKQINETPGWVFAGIYADEGISATSLKNRDEFNRMIADCYAGKIDVIVTKNVSRFARNVVDCLSVVRKLAQLNPPVGVRFENEGFDSRDATSELLLTVLAASAQEESKTKSNSMNWSLEKRFDNGQYLTPVLLGYDHDEEGHLVINPEEAITVKLMYYTFLAGFTLSEIAQLLNELNRPSKKGNVNWTSTGVRSIMVNERYCGDILSWKTYTYDFWEHKKRKNRRNRKQVLERNHHEAIVSHEIFEAVQTRLEMDKYAKDRHSFPTLNVVDEGVLQGFVSVNRTFRGFTDKDYISASNSVYESSKDDESDNSSSVKSGYDTHFNLDGFEIVRSHFFTLSDKPIMTINDGKMYFNTICMKKFQNVEYVELLINTVEKCVAIRPCDKNSPNAIRWGKIKDGRWIGSQVSIRGFASPLAAIAGWEDDSKYRLCGQYLFDGNNQLLLFDLAEPEIVRTVPMNDDSSSKGRNSFNPNDEKTESQFEDSGHEEDEVLVMGVETCYPESWNNRFGRSASEKPSWYIKRIFYHDDWEILRPARYYAMPGGLSETVLLEVKVESEKMIREMRCAV